LANSRRAALLFLVLFASRALGQAETPPQDGIARALAYTVTIEGQGLYGSGVLVDAAAGLVLTNWHVVSEMREPRCTFLDGETVLAKVLDSDRALDLALLKVPPQKRLQPAWGEAARLRPGDEVFAVGCPRHLAFTVTRGIVSFVGRLVDGLRYLQTDLPINDGNSGGPVVNARGELVGIVTFVYRRAQGLSFALPAETALERFAARLKRQP
jgi:S1-C subfamily serine protease